MRARLLTVSSFVLAAALAVPSTAAAADTLISPLVGVTFGADAPAAKPTFGGSVTFFGNSAGLELEYARTSNFFDENPEASVTTATASFIVGGNPDGKGTKPYALVGVGLIRPNVKGTDIFDDVHYNDFGIVLGIGVNSLVTDHVGVRGDLRYYRALQGPSDNGVIPIASNFDFFRAVVGLSLYF
jgi:opacity protein-like surface antigen